MSKISKTSVLVFQNDPAETHTSINKDISRVTLKGRFWTSIFDHKVVRGETLRWGGRNFKVDAVNLPKGSNMGDISISRIFNAKKGETVPSHEKATKLYIEAKRKEEEKENPPKPIAPTTEEVASYILYMHQDGGCDYTIGCGNVIEYIDAKDGKAAARRARKRIKDYGGKEIITDAVLFCVESKKQLI